MDSSQECIMIRNGLLETLRSENEEDFEDEI